MLLDRAGERKLLNNFIALDYYRDQAVGLQAQIEIGFGNVYET